MVEEQKGEGAGWGCGVRVWAEESETGDLQLSHSADSESIYPNHMVHR